MNIALIFVALFIVVVVDPTTQTQRLVCEPEGTKKEETNVLSDDIIQAINSLIDSKLQELEGKLEEKIWQRMMDVSEQSSAQGQVEKKEKSCDFKYNEKCFVFHHSDSMSYEEAEYHCKDDGGHMANIYDSTHEGVIVKFIRKKYNRPVFFYIGMRIDTETMKVTLYDGSEAPYINWYPDGGYPHKIHSLIRFTVLPTFTGMFNNVGKDSAKANGVLCES